MGGLALGWDGLGTSSLGNQGVQNWGLGFLADGISGFSLFHAGLRLVTRASRNITGLEVICGSSWLVLFLFWNKKSPGVPKA